MTQGNTIAIAFALAVLVIYLVLAAQFESFRDPFIILMAVPLSIFGAIVPLNLGLGTLNIYSQVGLITLIGLITKHGILMVEFANQQRETHGMRRREAIVAAAKIRLRPILMTTAAMALAVVPLIIAEGAGAAARYAMGLGTPPQILEMIGRGVDMFDCVMPTRVARHGQAFSLDGPIHIKNLAFERDPRPLCESAHPHVARFSRAYIRHCFRAGEILALRLLSIHNLHFFLRLAANAPEAISEGKFLEFKESFIRRYTQSKSE